MFDNTCAQHAVVLSDVTAGYRRGHPVLREVNVAWGCAGVVAVRGANGTGKSTLIEVCSGYVEPETGEVRVAGFSSSSVEVRPRRRVCRSAISLLPEMSAGDHLTLAARSSGTSPTALFERASAYGLEPWLGARTTTLSNGNKRKLWLVMCTPEPFEVVFLDEPFQGLDQEGVEILVDEIAQWRQERLVVLVAHDWPSPITPDTEFRLSPVGVDR